LIEELGTDHPVFGIQPALTAKHLDQFRSLPVTTANIVRALREFQPCGPYALAGYSYGGFLAYEAACQLQTLAERVDLLVILDTGPGTIGLRRRLRDQHRWFAAAAANLPHWLREEARDLSLGRLGRSAWRKLKFASRCLRGRLLHGRQPVLWELDDMFGVEHIPSQNHELMRTVFAAFRDYVPGPYRGTLTLFGASTRPLLGAFDTDLGWSRFADQVKLRTISGNHESILSRPNVLPLARQLRELLDGLDGTERTSERSQVGRGQGDPTAAPN
jgi:thioesterase domain-containing protein